MKFSSKLALVASASLLSLSTFAADPSLVGTAKVLDYDTMVTSFTTDMMGMDVTSVDRGALIKQDGSENATALIEAVSRARPPSAKGRFIETATLASTMSPGLPIDISKFVKI